MASGDSKRIDHEFIGGEISIPQWKIAHILGQKSDVRRISDQWTVVNLLASKNLANPPPARLWILYRLKPIDYLLTHLFILAVVDDSIQLAALEIDVDLSVVAF